MCKRKFIVQVYSVCDGVIIVVKYRIKLFCLTLSLMVSSLTFMILFTATATGAMTEIEIWKGRKKEVRVIQKRRTEKELQMKENEVLDCDMLFYSLSLTYGLHRDVQTSSPFMIACSGGWGRERACDNGCYLRATSDGTWTLRERQIERGRGKGS